MTDPLLIRSWNIPEEIREDVFEAVESTRADFSFSEAILKYFFEVHNRFLTTEPLKMSCPNCRSRVVGKLRMIANLWKQHGIFADGHQRDKKEGNLAGQGSS